MTGRLPEHRVRAPLSLQTWQWLTFLHWPVPAPLIQQMLPEGLTVDTYGGRAWLGVTPFRMRDVRVPLLPPVPHLSTFPEVNVRTYVRGRDGSTGIWFLSLDCARLPVVGALRTVGLPYHWSDSAVHRGGPGRLTYRSRRRRGGARMRAEVEVGTEVPEPDELTNFLTGRWSAYTRRCRRLWRVPVEHEPWPIRTAAARADVGALVGAAGLPEPQGAPLVHFSAQVHVRIGAPRPA